jgi:hypothetical protein
MNDDRELGIRIFEFKIHEVLEYDKARSDVAHDLQAQQFCFHACAVSIQGIVQEIKANPNDISRCRESLKGRTSH